MAKQIDLGQFIWPDVGQGRQPPTSIQIDASNPLTRGLYLLSYGDRGYDIVGQRTPTLSAASRTIIKAGGALAFTGGSTFSGESYPDVLGTVDQISVLVLGSIDNVSNRQALFTKGEDNPAGEWSLALGYNAGGAYSNFFFQSVQAPAASVDAKGTTTVANGEEFVVVGTYAKSGTICIYKNGKLEDSQAVGSAALRSDSTSPPLAFGVCNVAASGGGGTFYYQGKMALRAVWTRQLSAAEVAEISANPWQLFASPALGIGIPAAAGAFTFTGSGGIQFAGAATTSATVNFSATGSGGLQFGGAATASNTAAFSMSGAGGLQFGGTAAAQIDVGFSASGSGGLQFGGAATTTYSPAFVAAVSGGLQFGGTAAASFSASAYTYTGSGGLTFGGTADVQSSAQSKPAGAPGAAGRRKKPTVITPDTSEQRAQEFEELLARISGQAVQKAKAAVKQADVSALIDAPLPSPEDIRPARMPDVPATAKPYMQELLQSFREGYRQAYVNELARRIQIEAQARDDEEIELLALAL